MIVSAAFRYLRFVDVKNGCDSDWVEAQPWQWRQRQRELNKRQIHASPYTSRVVTQDIRNSYAYAYVLILRQITQQTLDLLAKLAEGVL